MKWLQIIFFFFLPIYSYCQSEIENSGTVSILIGAKTRVTPIYLNRVPDVIHLGNINILQQPDKHLSGPGLLIGERKEIETKISFSLSQVVRYDYIYQRRPLVYPPPDGFKYEIKQKILFDLYADIAKYIPARNSFFRISFGIGICGLNSGYIETLRVYQSQTAYTDFETKRNFIFPAATTGLGWQKKNFCAELKFGYCWNNPTLYDTPFLFPEVSLQYLLFGHHRKSKP